MNNKSNGKDVWIYAPSDGRSVVFNIARVADNLVIVSFNPHHTCKRHKEPTPELHIITDIVDPADESIEFYFYDKQTIIKVLHHLVLEKPEIGEAVGWILQEVNLEHSLNLEKENR